MNIYYFDISNHLSFLTRSPFWNFFIIHLYIPGNILSTNRTLIGMIFYTFRTLSANAVMATWKKNHVLGIHKTNDAVGLIFVVDVFVFVVFFFAKAVDFIHFVYFKLLTMIKELLLDIT